MSQQRMPSSGLSDKNQSISNVLTVDQELVLSQSIAALGEDGMQEKLKAFLEKANEQVEFLMMLKNYLESGNDVTAIMNFLYTKNLDELLDSSPHSKLAIGEEKLPSDREKIISSSYAPIVRSLSKEIKKNDRDEKIQEGFALNELEMQTMPYLSPGSLPLASNRPGFWLQSPSLEQAYSASYSSSSSNTSSDSISSLATTVDLDDGSAAESNNSVTRNFVSS